MDTVHQIINNPINNEVNKLPTENNYRFLLLTFYNMCYFYGLRT